MKKIFKLAAIAVSMALVASLVACSSGDDDVVDTSTGEYLLALQIGKYVESIDNYVASIDYDQNVSDAEIKSLKDVHDDVMALLGDCTDCLEAYFSQLKSLTYTDEEYPLYLWRVEYAKKQLNYLKRCGSHAKCEEALIYMPAIKEALEDVQSAKNKVASIGTPLGETILKGALNERQIASMDAYKDAVEALKAALSDDDSKKCKTKIDAADKAFETFEKLENKNVTKAEIKKVLDAVDEMYDDIQAKVVTKFWTEYNK